MSRASFPQAPPPGLEPVDYIRQALDYYAGSGHSPYRWARNPGPVPPVRLPFALKQARLALVASGGFYRHGQVAFHYCDDTSYRRIPMAAERGELRVAHFGYDLRDARRDPEILLPLAGLRQLEAEGAIGSLCADALTYMGGIYSQRRVSQELIPALTRELEALRAQAVLLVPACPVCHQNAGLIARHLEATGIATVMLSSAWEITALVHPPRAAYLDFPLGHTAGRVGEPAERIEILRRALTMLESANDSGIIEDLGYHWPGDWKRANTLGDYDWPGRIPNPVYQTEEDCRQAIRIHGESLALNAAPAGSVPAT
jgi:D-proline reductase (dithiol) PrdB